MTSRLLRRFGLGLVMFSLPVMLLGTSAYMLFAGTLVAAGLLRGSDWVWRYSTDKLSVELLYLPMTARVKFQMKWFIDTVIWRIGDGIAGLTVLFFAAYLKFTARQMSLTSQPTTDVGLLSSSFLHIVVAFSGSVRLWNAISTRSY